MESPVRGAGSRGPWRPRNPVAVVLSGLLGLLILLALIGGFIAFVDAVNGDDESATPSGSSGRAPHEIARVDYGAQWPFTVSHGKLACKNGAVTFEAGGKRYAVNTAAKEQGYDPIGSIRTGKADLSPVVNRGLELCG